MRLTSLAICCAIVTALAAAPAAADGDPAKGAEIARELCVSCHNVEPGGPFKLMPPSFAAISAYRTDEQIFARIMFPPPAGCTPACPKSATSRPPSTSPTSSRTSAPLRRGRLGNALASRRRSMHFLHVRSRHLRS